LSKLPLISGEELIKIAQKIGFTLIHVKGSHFVFKNAFGKRIVIPVHGKKPIGKGLLLKIIKEDFQLTRKEFEELI